MKIRLRRYEHEGSNVKTTSLSIDTEKIAWARYENNESLEGKGTRSRIEIQFVGSETLLILEGEAADYVVRDLEKEADQSWLLTTRTS